MVRDIFDGCPEFHKYRDDQARDPRTGRWVSEGADRQRIVQREARRTRERNRRIQEASSRLERERLTGSSDAHIGLVQHPGAEKPAQAIREVMARLPPDQRALLSNVPKAAVVDMARYGQLLGIDPNRPDAAFAIGFFNPGIGVVLGKGFTNSRFGFLEFGGPSQRSSLQKFAAHELGHAFDYYSVPGIQFGMSTALAGTLMAEYGNLTRAQKYFSEHYSAEKLPKELFAEVYSALYGGDDSKGKVYVGYSLTQQGVLRRFPRTVAAIKSWRPA